MKTFKLFLVASRVASGLASRGGLPEEKVKSVVVKYHEDMEVEHVGSRMLTA